MAEMDANGSAGQMDENDGVRGGLESMTGTVALKMLLGNEREYSEPRYVLPGAVAGVARAAMCVHDPDNLWPLLEHGFFRRLPQVKFKWGSRVLQNLQIEVVHPQHPSVAAHVSSALEGYKVPYLHVYIVKCDSLETYRAAVRPRIKAWVEEIQHSSNGLEQSEWLVIYVPFVFYSAAETDARQVGGAVATKIFDKIRSDFNVGKTESCCKITLYRDTPSEQQHGVAGDGEWFELLRRIFASLVSAFQVRCRKFEDQVMKLEQQADVPGWNYCTFLILKESLAFTWLQIGQNFDALRIFDSLLLQFDTLTGQKPLQQSTNKMVVNLFQAQSLKFPEGRGRASNDDSGQGVDGTDEGLANADSSSLLSANGKLITGRISKKISSSLSFGPNSDISMAPRTRAESVLPRHSLQSQNSSSSLPQSDSNPPPTLPPFLQRNQLQVAPLAASPAVSTAKTITPTSSSSSTQSSTPNSPNDSRLPTLIPSVLLDVKRKPYREQIYKSAMSVLEIRLYLFVRSTLVLFNIGRHDEALRRGIHFIDSFCKDMMECETPKELFELESEGNNKIYTQVVALVWACCASVELVCAAHAACDMHEEQEFAAETHLYQAELISYANHCFQSILHLLYPTSEQVATDVDVLAKFVQGRSRWAQDLPQILKGKDPTSWKSVLSSNEGLQTWVPAGLLQACLNAKQGVNFVSMFLQCESAYLRATGRNRTALQLSVRRLHLLSCDTRYRQARMVALELQKANEPDLNSNPILDAELKLLIAQLDTKIHEYEAALLTCLKVLRLHGVRKEQRELALEVLNESIPNISHTRLSAKRFPLFGFRVHETKSNSSERGIIDGGRRSFSVHRQGEAIRLSLELDSSLPKETQLEKIYVRYKLVSPHTNAGNSLISTRDDGPIRSNENPNNLTLDKASRLVRFRSAHESSDDPFEDESFYDEDDEDDDDEIDSDEEGDIDGHAFGGNVNASFLSNEDLDVSRADSENYTQLSPKNFATVQEELSQLSTKSQDRATSPEHDTDEYTDGTNSPGYLSSTAQSPLRQRRALERHHTHRSTNHGSEGGKSLYFDLENVKLLRGHQTLELFASPVSRHGFPHAVGTYTLDRVVFQFSKTFDLVFSVPNQDVEHALSIVPLPTLLSPEFSSESGGFVAVDENSNGHVPIFLQFRLTDISPLPKISQFSFVVGFEGEGEDGTNGVSGPQRHLEPSESGTVSISSEDLEKRMNLEGGSFLEAVSRIGVQTAHIAKSSDVDRVVVVHKTDTQVLQPSGMARNLANTVRDCKLTVDMKVAIDEELEAGKDHGKVIFDQSRILSLRFGSPYLVSQCTRLVGKFVWITVNLQSNLPVQSEIICPRLEDGRQISPSDRFTVGGGQDIQLSFQVPLKESMGNADIFLGFSTKYSFGSGKTRYEGFIERRIGFRQVSVSTSIIVRALCANVDSLRVGSTAVFVYNVERSREKTWLVEPLLEQTKNKLIDISSTPASARSRRFQGMKKQYSFELSDVEELDRMSEDVLKVVYEIIFDPNQWMVVGVERGHILIDGPTKLACEFVPLRAGPLVRPILQPVNLPLAAAERREFVQVL